MATDESAAIAHSLYKQRGAAAMERDGDHVAPEFCFKFNPAMCEVPEQDIQYPLGEIPSSGDLVYDLGGEPEQQPEMDFRALANGMEEGVSIPNTTYLTHGIHKHPAIFIPHIPSYVIRQFTDSKNEDGDRPLVMDPFSGSGTTGVEAKIHGRDYLGVEINPLSRLVGEVASTPLPPTVLQRAAAYITERLDETDDVLYDAYDVEFLDRTDKEHWFEPSAIQGLTRVRKVVDEFNQGQLPIEEWVTKEELAAIRDVGLSDADVQQRLYRWLVLMVGNTVFEVSNADPGVSKAYKSKKMREGIESGTHPSDVLETFKEEVAESRQQLTALWDRVYDTSHQIDIDQSTLSEFSTDETDTAPSVDGNLAHQATTDIRLGDAREFQAEEHLEGVDLAITSPPYITAMNYYRGTKLRLFWIRDLLEADGMFDPEELRKSIVGTTSVSMRDVEGLPFALRDIWTGSDEMFDDTRLAHLDDTIERIHNTDYNSAEKRGYVTWRFFAEDMLRVLTRVYEHLKPGAYFFFLVGENTICEQLVHSHKYIADIARNLGRFEGHGGDLGEEEGYRVVGSLWDEITNRDLFQSRNHEGGVIESEWMVVLQKPR